MKNILTFVFAIVSFTINKIIATDVLYFSSVMCSIIDDKNNKVNIELLNPNVLTKKENKSQYHNMYIYIAKGFIGSICGLSLYSLYSLNKEESSLKSFFLCSGLGFVAGSILTYFQAEKIYKKNKKRTIFFDSAFEYQKQNIVNCLQENFIAECTNILNSSSEKSVSDDKKAFLESVGSCLKEDEKGSWKVIEAIGNNFKDNESVCSCLNNLYKSYWNAIYYGVFKNKMPRFFERTSMNDYYPQEKAIVTPRLSKEMFEEIGKNKLNSLLKGYDIDKLNYREVLSS